MVEEKQAKGLKMKNELKRPDTCLSQDDKKYLTEKEKNTTWV